MCVMKCTRTHILECWSVCSSWNLEIYRLICELITTEKDHNFNGIHINFIEHT
jgi:hypothetical protein